MLSPSSEQRLRAALAAALRERDEAREHLQTLRAVTVEATRAANASRERLEAAESEAAALRGALEAVVGRGYLETKPPASQDHVSKSAIALVRAALAQIGAA